MKLPKENEADISAFYGPIGLESNLDWFEFPVGDAVLYTRGGTPLVSRVGNPLLDDHRVHKKCAPFLQAALLEIYTKIGRERFIKEGWHVWGGSFFVRPKRGGTRPSTHSWGVAVDFCPGENPLFLNGRKTDEKTFSDEAIDVMEKHGWLSGGRAWRNDWMHFQRVVPFISPGSYYARKGLPKHIEA